MSEQVTKEEILSAFQKEAPDEFVQLVQADAAAVRYLLEHESEFFIEFFLQEELEFPVPEIHKDIFGKMINREVLRMLLAIPRGHAKTTLAKLAVVWYFLFSKYRFCVYVSNTSGVAVNACRDIMHFLHGENFKSVFGEIRVIKENESKGLWIFDINLGNGKIKRCILRAAGANQQMRGINVDHRRPEIAVVDDLEDLENTESPSQQEKLDRWVFATFLKALARNSKVIWIGNMLKSTSLLSRLSKRPKWNPIVYGCLVRDKVTATLRPLWPDLWPIEKIVEDMQEYREMGQLETWMCEMMNMPGRGKNGFGQNQINYVPVPNPEDCVGAFITIDPAFGEDTKIHDSTAIVTHAIPDGDITRVVDYENGHMREHEVFEKALEMATRWNAWVWGIESVAGQSALITLFELLAAKYEVHGQIEFVPLSPAMRKKAQRISAFVAAMESGTYGIPENDVDITTQLLSYDVTVRDQVDDLCDGCAYGLDMIEDFYGLILYQFQQQSGIAEAHPNARTGMEVYGA